MVKPEIKFNLSVRWWRSGRGSKIRPMDVDNLRYHALKVAAKRSADGFVCGDLYYGCGTENGIIEYAGWWELTQ